MGIAVPKPQRSTPESRRSEKRQREVNPFKAAVLHREPIRDQEQKPTLKPGKDGIPTIDGSTLRPFSKKRWDRLKKQGKALHSTFAGTDVADHTKTPLRRRLVASENHPESDTPKRLKVNASGMKALNRVKILKPVGRRGRRLAPGDRKQEAITHKMRCYCGCMDEWGRDPEPGEVSRAHLASRAYEAERNADHNNIPACADLAEWLDHNEQGVHAKAELLELAQAQYKAAKAEMAAAGVEGEPHVRLTPEEVRPVLEKWCYYTWYADRRRMER